MTMRRPFAVCLLVASLLCSGAAQAQFGGTQSNKELEARANQAESRLQALEARLNQSLVDPQRQIEASQQDLRTLRGQVDEARNELEQLRQSMQHLIQHHFGGPLGRPGPFPGIR